MERLDWLILFFYKNRLLTQFWVSKFDGNQVGNVLRPVRNSIGRPVFFNARETKDFENVYICALISVMIHVSMGF